MFRATTPLHRFVFKDDPQNYEKILIIYAHGGQVFLEKTKDDLTFSTEEKDGVTKYVASVRLTQEETKRFRADAHGKTTYVQIRVLDSNLYAYASDKIMINVRDVLDDQVLRRTENNGN